MKKANHQGKVLRDHKKVGKKFLPPMMQIPNMMETSFVDERLPCLVWMSALYKRCSGRAATNAIVEFVTDAEKVITGFKHPSLKFLGSYLTLTNEQKKAIYNAVRSKEYFNLLLDNLEHQYHLLDGYPLSFLFENHDYGVDRRDAIELLKEDVSSLLDRNGEHATKVQVTAVYTDMVTERLKVSSHISMPDFNAIFERPGSEEAKRAAGFARANINGTAAALGVKELSIPTHNWAEKFWNAAYKLDGCTNGY